jgi:hypothetical protein
MVPFLSRWFDARIRRIVREEEAMVRFDARSAILHADEYKRQLAEASVAAMRQRELTHG